jgi:hypothetical protein
MDCRGNLYLRTLLKFVDKIQFWLKPDKKKKEQFKQKPKCIFECISFFPVALMTAHGVAMEANFTDEISERTSNIALYVHFLPLLITALLHQSSDRD